MSDAGFTSLVIILCLFDVFPISDQTSPGYGMYLFIFDFSGLGFLSPSIVIIYMNYIQSPLLASVTLGFF